MNLASRLLSSDAVAVSHPLSLSVSPSSSSVACSNAERLPEVCDAVAVSHSLPSSVSPPECTLLPTLVSSAVPSIAFSDTHPRSNLMRSMPLALRRVWVAWMISPGLQMPASALLVSKPSRTLAGQRTLYLEASPSNGAPLSVSVAVSVSSSLSESSSLSSPWAVSSFFSNGVPSPAAVLTQTFLPPLLNIIRSTSGVRGRDSNDSIISPGFKIPMSWDFMSNPARHLDGTRHLY